jgi:hypothetical protein
MKMRMARRAGAGGLAAVGEGFERTARDAHQQAQSIRALLFANPPMAVGEAPSGRATPASTRKAASRERPRTRVRTRARQ